MYYIGDVEVPAAAVGDRVIGGGAPAAPAADNGDLWPRHQEPGLGRYRVFP